MKIDIQVEDNRKYASIALLVDRDDFIEDIKNVRRQINLTKLPYTFPTYPYDEANKIIGFYKNHLIGVSGIKQLLSDFCREKGLLNLYALDKTLGGAAIFAESLAKKYSKNYLYIPTILASILTAQITEDDFLSTQMYEINHKVVQDELNLLEENEEIVTIRVNRESTSKEVESVFDFIQKYYFKVKPTDPEDGLNNIYDKTYNSKIIDTAGNIKRDREWYWLWKEEKKNGKGAYNRILDQWNKKIPQKYIDDTNIIEQAVSRYRKLLNTDI